MSKSTRSGLTAKMNGLGETRNAHVFSDKDSQANRYRKTINALEKMTVFTDPKAIKKANTTWYSKNIKDDGVAYQDLKTKARKFDITKFAHSFDPQRHLAMTVGDAIIDPTITIKHEE